MKSTILHRDEHIDVIRGCAIIIMILTHVSSIYLPDHIPLTLFTIGNYIPFTFVITSSMLFINKYNKKTILFSDVLNRVKRLLLPYYIFITVFLLLVYFKEHTRINLSFLFNLFVIRIDGNFIWVILLFLQLALVNSALVVLFRKIRILFYGYTFAALLLSGIFITWIPKVDFRSIMWISWSLITCVVLISANASRITKNRIVTYSVLVALVSAFIYFFARDVVDSHKHPPDLIYLSLGFLQFCIISAAVRYVIKGKYRLIIQYVGRHSYIMYFAHQLWLYILTDLLITKSELWYMSFVYILTLSIVTTYLYNQTVKRISYTPPNAQGT